MEPCEQTMVMPVPVNRHLSSRRKGNEGASLLQDNRATRVVRARVGVFLVVSGCA